jgi:hypothetical protein
VSEAMYPTMKKKEKRKKQKEKKEKEEKEEEEGTMAGSSLASDATSWR